MLELRSLRAGKPCNLTDVRADDFARQGVDYSNIPDEESVPRAVENHRTIKPSGIRIDNLAGIGVDEEGLTGAGALTLPAPAQDRSVQNDIHTCRRHQQVGLLPVDDSLHE